MKKLIYTLLLAFLPLGLSAQEWHEVRIDDLPDLLSIREVSHGKLAFLVDEAFMKNCAPPTEFRTFKDGGIGVSIVTLSKSHVQQARVIYIDVEPFESAELGFHYRLNIFSEKSARSLLVTYLPKRKMGLRDEYSPEGVDVREEIVVIHDYRTPPHRLKAQQEVKEREDAGLPPVEFDDLELEYEYTEEYKYTPDWVYSMSPDGRYHRKRILGYLDSGLMPGPGHTIMGVRIQATPYSVEPGKKVYRIKLVLHGGKELYRRIVVLTDIDQSP